MNATKTEKKVSIRVPAIGGLWRTIEVPASQAGPAIVRYESGRSPQAFRSASRPQAWTR